ncbi:hypothetical protein E2C01_095117 [Portunus trituberculatus]|uniref:CCHC-type domain-containing protein n=1 Tax=Portunus trituberculatus TaxID=210409 RepID=A0A5B7JXY6_PORTR|nr:hypothetical protein [Portunus trituberculatus]
MAGADVTADDVTEEPLVASYRQRGPTPCWPECAPQSSGLPGKFCHYCGEKHGKAPCPARNLVCKSCGKRGHVKVCRAAKKQDMAVNSVTVGSVAVAPATGDSDGGRGHRSTGVCCRPQTHVHAWSLACASAASGWHTEPRQNTALQSGGSYLPHQPPGLHHVPGCALCGERGAGVPVVHHLKGTRPHPPIFSQAFSRNSWGGSDGQRRPQRAGSACSYPHTALGGERHLAGAVATEAHLGIRLQH